MKAEAAVADEADAAVEAFEASVRSIRRVHVKGRICLIRCWFV